MSPDVPVSVKARLPNRAKRQGSELEPLLLRNACERLLYRLGASAARERCALKGAGLLTIRMAEPYRATRDLELLGFGSNIAVGSPFGSAWDPVGLWTVSKT